jgi:hypothetical protein
MEPRSRQQEGRSPQNMLKKIARSIAKTAYQWIWGEWDKWQEIAPVCRTLSSIMAFTHRCMVSEYVI